MLEIANKIYNHNSPLRYPGGKSCLSDFLIKTIDQNGLVGCTYVEPYAGGSGAALTLLMLEKVDQIIINDLDRAIYCLWKSILCDTKKFIDKLRRTSISIEEWHKQKKIYKTTKSDFKLGFATFYLNRTNRSGIICGGPIGGIEQGGNWKIDARFNKIELIRRIEKIAIYKNRIKITNQDGIDLLNSLKGKENTFVYLDPPYYEKGSSLYLNHFKHSNHIDLAITLNNLKDLKWVMTYDNVEQISSLYLDKRQYEFNLNYSADKPKKGKELLILSDKIELPKVYKHDT